MPIVLLFFLAIVVLLIYIVHKHGVQIWDAFFPPSIGNPRQQQSNTSEHVTPLSHVRGDAFEDFIGGMTFGSAHFELVYRTVSYQEARAKYDPNVKKPDFKFRCNRRRREFWVEAKFRISTVEGKVEWCHWDQLQRYRKVNSTEPVFIAIGLGGEPSRPKRVFLVPLDALKYTGVYLFVIEPYEILPNKPLTSDGLWSLVAKR